MSFLLCRLQLQHLRLSVSDDWCEVLSALKTAKKLFMYSFFLNVFQNQFTSRDLLYFWYNKQLSCKASNFQP